VEIGGSGRPKVVLKSLFKFVLNEVWQDKTKYVLNNVLYLPLSNNEV
jgi:hypothetical protein